MKGFLRFAQNDNGEMRAISSPVTFSALQVVPVFSLLDGV